MNDTYWEHEQHFKKDKNCSTCFSESVRMDDLTKLTMDFFSNLYEGQRKIANASKNETV